MSELHYTTSVNSLLDKVRIYYDCYQNVYTIGKLWNEDPEEFPKSSFTYIIMRNGEDIVSFLTSKTKEEAQIELDDLACDMGLLASKYLC